ncbi:MAG TPA: c-type cytochrome [Burkholderiales bacterium]
MRDIPIYRSALFAAAVAAAWAALAGAALAQDGERSGKQIVEEQCVKCHRTGVNGAPKIGDRDAWIPRMKQGLDALVRAAIRGHGGMPARGGRADLTDSEFRAAILYMFNPTAAAAAPAESGAPPAQPPGPNHKTVGSLDVDLGIVPARSLLAFPRDSVERSMHGGVPSGKDYYHLNVSLADARTHAPVGDASVAVDIEEPGITRTSTRLEPMAVGPASYGNYVRLKPHTAYLITVHVRAPSAPPGAQAQFEHRTD